MVKILAHIAGTSGSGKSYIGEKLKLFGYKVKDLDDFSSIKDYKKFIKKLNDDSNMILVGYNDSHGKFLEIKTNNKFYIKEDINKIIERKLNRDMSYLFKNKKMIINKIMNKNYKINFDYNDMKNYILKDDDLYIYKNNYKPKTQKEILKFFLD